MSLDQSSLETLAAEIKNDPLHRGYLAVTSDDISWNIFNFLRDPAINRLAELNIAEWQLTIEDVRAALILARA